MIRDSKVTKERPRHFFVIVVTFVADSSWPSRLTSWPPAFRLGCATWNATVVDRGRARASAGPRTERSPRNCPRRRSGRCSWRSWPDAPPGVRKRTCDGSGSATGSRGLPASTSARSWIWTDTCSPRRLTSRPSSCRRSHRSVHLRALDRLEQHGYEFGARRGVVLATPARASVADRVASSVHGIPLDRETLAHPYYNGLRFMIHTRAPGGDDIPLIDGGVFNWVARLAANRRFVFVGRGMGAPLAAFLFWTARRWNVEGKIQIAGFKALSGSWK